MFVPFWLAGFRGAHHSHLPITPVDSDSAADPCDEADFELPDGKTMIEQFMASLAQEVDNEYRGLAHLLSTLPVPIGGAQPEALLVEHSLRHYLLLRLGPRGWFRRHQRKHWERSASPKWSFTNMPQPISGQQINWFPQSNWSSQSISGLMISMLTCTSDFLLQ